MIDALEAGDRYYTCRTEKAGNTTISRQAIHEGSVREVFRDESGHVTGALLSWNGNVPRGRSYRYELARLRLYHPTPKRDPWDRDEASFQKRIESAKALASKERAAWRARLKARRALLAGEVSR